MEDEKKKQVANEPCFDISDETDAESPGKQKKLKYPKSVFFIFGNEFCERFSYYGMRTILVIYLRNVLKYTDDDATVIYHIFAMVCYFFPLLGAIIADNWLGRYKTILSLSIVYALGNIVLSFASATGAIDIPGREITILGLVLIALGTGGIKPCVSAFGGDQFKLPEQEKQLQKFFSVFYFSINAGSLISTFLTPVLREDVKCLDQDSCYPLAFGVPAVLMIVSVCFFVFGSSFYVFKKPQGNVIFDVCKCVGHALSRKHKSKGVEREHWLDHADDKYDAEFIKGTKATLGVLFLYLPLPIFWALYEQQGSRWTFQATRMNGAVGSWAVKPDQMQIANPIMIILFIPLFEAALYPLLAKCNLLKSPLQRMSVGGILAALAFVVSALVEFQLEPTYAKLPGAGEAQLRIFNGFNCSLQMNSSFSGEVDLDSLGMWNNFTLPVSGNDTYDVSISGCNMTSQVTSITVTEEEAVSYFITNNQGLLDIVSATSPDTSYDIIDKSDDGLPTIKVLYNLLSSNYTKIEFLDSDGDSELSLDIFSNTTVTKYGLIDQATYTAWLRGSEDVKIGDFYLEFGGVYTLVVSEISDGDVVSELHTVTEPNSVHMFWLIPQYFVMTVGELFFSITGLEFSFTQAPVTMKSVLQSAWLVTDAVGNLVVVIIAEAKIFNSQAYEFILFAGIMLVDMAVFIYMATRYKYVNFSDSSSIQDGDSQSSQIPLEKQKNEIDNVNHSAEE